jgi:hypothetical protein
VEEFIELQLHLIKYHLCLRTIIQQSLHSLIISYHYSQYRCQCAFQFQQSFQEGSCCLLASAFVAGVALEIVAVSAVESQETAFLIVFVLDVHGLSETFAELDGLFDSGVGEFTTPFEDEEHFRWCAGIFSPFDGFELDFSAEAFERMSFQNGLELHQFGNPFFFLLQIELLSFLLQVLLLFLQILIFEYLIQQLSCNVQKLLQLRRRLQLHFFLKVLLIIEELEEYRMTRLHLHLLLGCPITMSKHSNDRSEFPLKIIFFKLIGSVWLCGTFFFFIF